jgi:hypothetical protein
VTTALPRDLVIENRVLNQEDEPQMNELGSSTEVNLWVAALRSQFGTRAANRGKLYTAPKRYQGASSASE